MGWAQLVTIIIDVISGIEPGEGPGSGPQIAVCRQDTELPAVRDRPYPQVRIGL